MLKIRSIVILSVVIAAAACTESSEPAPPSLSIAAGERTVAETGVVRWEIDQGMPATIVAVDRRGDATCTAELAPPVPVTDCAFPPLEYVARDVAAPAATEVAAVGPFTCVLACWRAYNTCLSTANTPAQIADCIAAYADCVYGCYKSVQASTESL